MIDPVPADQLEYQIGSGSNCIDNTLAALRPVVAQDRVMPRLQIRHHLAEGTARCTPTDFVRFQHGNIDPCFGQMQGGGQAGEASANDSDSNMSLAFERLRDRRWWRVVDIDGGWSGAVNACVYEVGARIVMMGQNDEPTAWAMRLIEGCKISSKLHA